MSIYLKHEKIKGSVTHKDFKDWLEVASVEWGVGRYIGQSVGNSANREAGLATISEIHIRRGIDASSPMLFESASKKKESYKVELAFVTTGETSYVKFELENAMLSSYSFKGNAQGGKRRAYRSPSPRWNSSIFRLEPTTNREAASSEPSMGRRQIDPLRKLANFF